MLKFSGHHQLAVNAFVIFVSFFFLIFYIPGKQCQLFFLFSSSHVVVLSIMDTVGNFLHKIFSIIKFTHKIIILIQ